MINIIQLINIHTKDGKSLLFKNYGEIKVDRDLLAGFLSVFSEVIKEISQSEIKSTITENFKYYYMILDSIIIVVCANLEDEDMKIYSKITRIKTKFKEKYGTIIENGSWAGRRSVFNDFEKELDTIVLNS